MFSQFKKASALLQIFLLVVANAFIAILYAGNWIAYSYKTLAYATIVLFLAFMAGNVGITEGEGYTLKPANKPRRIAAVATVAIAIIVAAIKAYGLTQ